MVAKTLIQMVLFFISMVMIGTFALETLGRWSSSNGPLAIARLKTEIINPKAANNTYQLELVFKRQMGDSVTTTTEVSKHIYKSSSVGSLIPIHYQLHNPKNTVVATEGWFEWRTLAILAFGLVLLYACFNVKESSKAVT
ncbi:hypothetical protein [Hymenobacter negativus]|uniref:DUF3592 domain-containing protein n=1 Tax=Hymenobacter negativus TaxID=2795026 RepID=A0ABS0QCN8_9BACT|nr:hypothetical protein [Hymenobacter negativus]MBH8560103.1 hypothetical protein [Hymenobacter negativus]